MDALDAVSTDAGRKENKAKLANLQQHEMVVNQYKDIIHEQVFSLRRNRSDCFNIQGKTET